MKINKVVIWGHRPKKTFGVGNFKRMSHTHSYIHAGFYKAFQNLGLDTIWVEDSSRNSSMDLNGALIVTEGQVDRHLPIIENATYVAHHGSRLEFDNPKIRRLRLQNYVSDLQRGESYNYPGSTVEKIDSVTFYDSENRALYQPWATNLLPVEIKEMQNLNPSPTPGLVNYVGTINHDGIKPKFLEAKAAAESSGLQLVHYQGVSDHEAMALIRDSQFAIDIRGNWHLERGYIPCRLWKALSYSKWTGSNSLLLKEIFEDRLSFGESGSELIGSTSGASKKANVQQIADNANWVSANHTYLNRASRLIEFAGHL